MAFLFYSSLISCFFVFLKFSPVVLLADVIVRSFEPSVSEKDFTSTHYMTDRFLLFVAISALVVADGFDHLLKDVF